MEFMKKEKYIVTLTRPEGVKDIEIKNYIAGAVAEYGGGFRPPQSYGEDDPGDLLFGGVECTVTKQRKGKNYEYQCH